MTAHDVRFSDRDSDRRRPAGRGWTEKVLAAALVAVSLATGLIYTFSVAVMPNLADTGDVTFVASMQRDIGNPVFALTFTAAFALLVLAAVLQRRRAPGAAVRWTVAAVVLFGVVLVITGAVHIPLNDKIDQVDLDRLAEVADVRDEVETPWVVGNVVRVVFSTAAVAALAWSLFLHGRTTAGDHDPARRSTLAASRQVAGGAPPRMGASDGPRP